jgi:protein-tyrosine phosphatase
MRLLFALTLALSSPLASAAGLSVLGAGPPLPSQWGKNNFHLVESDAGTGFAVYRTSKPDREDMRRFCELGITEMLVLSGNADKHELKYAAECPTLKVVANLKQDDKVPVDRAFLAEFDQWIEQARLAGKKVAFRCDCGCHRTGRLAAYYQMKYQHLSLEDAVTLLNANGQWMAFYPHIKKQVQALHDYIQGQPCSTDRKYCVRD